METAGGGKLITETRAAKPRSHDKPGRGGGVALPNHVERKAVYPMSKTEMDPLA
jgi:hypothetical protein